MALPPAPFRTFDEASRAVLDYLQETIPMGLWMVTRTAGDDWIVLHSADRSYQVHGGTVFRWSESFCSRMVRDEGPRMAPVAQDVPAYAAAEIGRAVPIGSYVGVPLVNQDGSLFGTLCAIDPDPRDEGLLAHGPEIELLARLLGTVLASDRRAADERWAAEAARREATSDALTGLLNRRGWEALVAAEDERCRRFGDQAAVVILDLDDLKLVNDRGGHAAGDAYLARVADALSECLGPSDVAARLGGDEFGLLLPGAEPDQAAATVARVRAALAARTVSASLGLALRDPRLSLAEAVACADAAMYRDKRARRSRPA